MSLHDRYTILLDKCVSSLTTWKNLINETLEDGDLETETVRIKEMAKEYCIIDNNHKKSENAIKALEDHMSDPSQSYDIDDLYSQKFMEQPDKDPTENEIWRQLFCDDLSIQEVKMINKNKTASQYEQVDDSLLCSTSFAPPVDPISKTIIRKPIRNKRCNHVYDKNSIYDYIRQSKNKAKCPYMGCRNNKLLVQHLVEDGSLEEQISQFLANHQSSDEDD
ncbi:E3 SUMO-protein ligase NSE2-like [Anthonomus grandis grandis]|uniref:E3 SUMO-protein ligase NSE2-like n=1 Tax=Anthonomus grandis grandis TaxID=2921223 RepID=UPI002164F061|nr:E3 SUMO-protein ligase NSE2-like [Anthonomus grandis grandis]